MAGMMTMSQIWMFAASTFMRQIFLKPWIVKFEIIYLYHPTSYEIDFFSDRNRSIMTANRSPSVICIKEFLCLKIYFIRVVHVKTDVQLEKPKTTCWKFKTVRSKTYRTSLKSESEVSNPIVNIFIWYIQPQLLSFLLPND